MCRLATLCALVLATLACGRVDGSGGWEGTTADSAGIAIVHNGSNGVWDDTSGWSVTEVLRIGDEPGPEYQFGYIGGVAALSDGRVVVVDRQAQNLRVYDESGQFIATLAGPGAGPGELGFGAGPVFRGRADTILVVDNGNRRINIFAPDGVSADGYRLDYNRGQPIRWEVSSSGNLFVQLRPHSAWRSPEPDLMDKVLELGADGSVIDTLFSTPSGNTSGAATGRLEWNYFSPEPIWGPHGADGLFFARDDRYTIHWHAPDGSLRRIIHMPFERREVGEEDKQAVEDALGRIFTAQGARPQDLPAILEVYNFETQLPAFFQILAGPGRTLWVQRVRAPSELAPDELGRHAFRSPNGNVIGRLQVGSYEWDVFDDIGRFLGVVTFPRRYEPLVFRENHAYGIWTDDLDVHHVMVLRIDQG